MAPPDSNATGPYTPGPPAAAPAERFAPGAVLAGRYRIVAALGQGGMGEVWRADDLALGVPVALKFLPSHLANDPDRLTRFRHEVAVARQVSHPNCCRVYDLGESPRGAGAAPLAFLSMEYIDGESLDALLRRVGRLPEEKAVEVARQLCAALQAVHEQGLLHRDLKPANVMLDGRGKVRLTDFGLAAAVEDLSATELRSGTPLYMAPEQLAGKEVTERSDLFALGLVLYELFTGKKAFAGLDRDTPPSKPSSHVSSLDPAVERVILRCLARDPKDRPVSALAVAAALPGGDPLAAALAAGETPSPQLVADAGGEGAIRPGVGLALLGVVVVSIVLVALLADRVMLFRKVPLPEPPEVLARRARQVLEHCGYADPPADTAYHFCADAEYLVGTMHEDASPRRWDRLATARPAALYFFYRQSSRPLVPTVRESVLDIQDALVTESNPPPTLPGMAGIHLAPNGWLLRLSAVPAPWSEAPPTPAAVDWSRWFDPATIGFDLGKDLTEVPPQWTPPGACDRQAAWSGILPDCPDVPVRVEAAAYRGRPVYFQVMPVWRDPVRSYRPPPSPGSPLGPFFWGFPVIVVLAIRNLRRGRGDLRGAVRLGLAIVTVLAGAWLIGGRHRLAQEMSQAGLVLGLGGIAGLLYGLSYLAIEPAIRRRWPWRLTAWNRLLDGRLRDPMVGRDLLIGLTLGAVAMFIPRLGSLAAEWVGLPPPPPLTGTGPDALRIPGPPTPLYVLLTFPVIPIVVPIMWLLLSFLFFLVLRWERLAWVATWLLIVTMFAIPFLGPNLAGNALMLFGTALLIGLQAFVLARFGLLAFAGLLFCDGLLSLAPLTADLSAWYAWQGVVMALVMVGLAVYGFVTATRGQRLFREGFFGDE
jgi:serine/threonine-protein kinase